MKYSIEKLKKEDIESAYEVIEDAFENNEPEAKKFLTASFEERKAFGALEFYVAKVNKKIVGVMGVFALEWAPKDVLWLCYPSMKKGFQGKGLGTKLLNRIIKEVKNKGIKRICADSSFSPESVKKFYEKNGFLETGYMEDYYKPGETIKYLVKTIE